MASPARRPLAILGASPTFQAPLHVGRPNIGDRDRFIATLARAFDDRWFTNDGPLVRAFEEAIATEVGARRCVTLANGTLGLQLLVRALALSGEVIVPSFTFISTASALSWEGLTPVFCDVDPQTHMIDANHAESLVSERTSAILGVHLWGGLCDSGALEALAQRSGVPLIFDGAHALGAKREGRGPGSIGKATMLSFHATKIVNAFEGGAIVTDDEELADRLALMRNFGFTGPDSVVTLGINAKMNEASAAMGLNTLTDLQDTIALNCDRHAHYRAAFDGFAQLQLIADPPPQVASNHHYLVAEVSRTGPLNRDQLQAVLEAEGVLARRYFYPGCHRSAPYAGETRIAPLPATNALCDRILQFPTGSTVTHDDIAKIAEIVAAAFAQHSAVAGSLERQAT